MTSPAPDFNVAEAPDTPPGSPGGPAPAAESVPVEVERMVKRILFFRNPFDQLGVRPEAATDEARRRYRRLSLVVHPDKCKHPRAAEATDTLTKALKALESPDARKPFVELIQHAREKVATTWRRQHKTPKPVNIPEGEDAGDVWRHAEFDPAFLYDVRRETHNLIGETETRKKRAVEVAQAMDKRAKDEQDETRDLWKQREERQKNWEAGREERVEGWRKFLEKGSKNPKKRQKVGLAPPKLKKEERVEQPPQ